MGATITAGSPGDLRARMLVRQLDRLEYGRVVLKLPNASQAVFEGPHEGPAAKVHLHNAHLLDRLTKSGALGLAESYMAGEWDSPDPATALRLFLLNYDAVAPRLTHHKWVFRVLTKLRHRLRENNRRGAKRNIAYHYDLGNSFYALWLDTTWTYSSAIFARADQSLAEAQGAKYQRLLDRLDVKPGDHILEIGCGWGGFARHAATHADVSVTGITLSEEQLRFARSMAAEAGLADRVHFELRDYRDVRQQYDHVVSIEMYEAVGEAYWPDYFGAIQACLKPGGRAAIQAITIDESRYAAYRQDVDFIQRYIFPGGMLASPTVFGQQASAAGLAERERAFFGSHYARTLARWDARVVAQKAPIVAERGERFYRMWRYYLAYCEAGFAGGNIDLMQIVLERPVD